MTEHTEVVIYKETMSQLANFYTTLDKSEKIERFACVVEGVNSKFNKKYKAGDLKYSEYSGDMITDLIAGAVLSPILAAIYSKKRISQQ